MVENFDGSFGAGRAIEVAVGILAGVLAYALVGLIGEHWTGFAEGSAPSADRPPLWAAERTAQTARPQPAGDSDGLDDCRNRIEPRCGVVTEAAM